nr:hypothetical protein [Tanacetum cinerariifolium]
MRAGKAWMENWMNRNNPLHGGRCSLLDGSYQVILSVDDAIANLHRSKSRALSSLYSGGKSRGNGGDGICGSGDDNGESGDGGGVVTQYARCGGGVAAYSSVSNESVSLADGA